MNLPKKDYSLSQNRNVHDQRDCLELGEKAENLFAFIAQKRGWLVTQADRTENINEHWDWLIRKDQKRYKIDVKARKRISRHDANVQDTWLWIELHGVRPTDAGWLYAGKADLLAFEQEKSFFLVSRLALVQLIDKIVDKQTIVLTAKEAKYKIYNRPGRSDSLTLIEIAKLEPIRWEEWSK